MRLVLLFLLASVVGYGVLQIDKLDPNNYVKMYIAGYTVEIKVLGFLLLLIGLVIVLYLVFWLLRIVWRSPTIYSKWRKQKDHDLAEQEFGAGYLSLIKGDWRKAERQLLSKPAHSAVPYVNYLAAAQAAQQLGEMEKRDDYLAKAYQAAPTERLAIGLTKAKLHQQAGQMEQALATLEDISEAGQKNPQFIAMMLQIREKMNDWQNALALLPAARKQQALPEPVLAQIESTIYRTSLERANDIDLAWRELPRDQKKSLGNIVAYVKKLAAQGQVEMAEKLIRNTLKHSWDDNLVGVYGTLKSNKPLKSLRQVEGWLMARPENAELHLAAGRFALAGGNNENSKTHLQKAISLAQLPAAYALLGQILEGEDENSKALQLYRSGIKALTQQSSAHLELSS